MISTSVDETPPPLFFFFLFPPLEILGGDRTDGWLRMDVDDDGRAFSRTILIGLIVARKSETSTDAIWLLESTSFNP